MIEWQYPKTKVCFKTFFYWKNKAKLELTRKKMYTANALVLWRQPVLSTNCINPSWSFRLPIGNPKKCYPWSFFKPSCTIYHTTTHWHCSWTKDLTDPLLNLLPNARSPKAFFLPTTNHNNDTWLSWWRQREYRYVDAKRSAVASEVEIGYEGISMTKFNSQKWQYN